MSTNYETKQEKLCALKELDQEETAELFAQVVTDQVPSDGNTYIRKPPLRLETVSASELQKKKLQAPHFAVGGLISQGLTIIASPPKYGKSWLVLDLCLSVASGMQFLNRQTTKGRALYLALEDSEFRLKDRMEKVLGARTAPENFDFAVRAHTIGGGLLDELDSYITDHPDTSLIVVDTLQKVRDSAVKNEGAYAGDYRELGKLKSFADANKICVVIVHHLRKATDDSDPFNRISGTNGISGSADTMLVLSRSKRTDSQTTLSIIGRDIESDEIVLEFDKTLYRWRRIGDVVDIEREQELREYEASPIVQTVRELLNRNPGGWTGTAEDLFLACAETVGAYPADSLSSLGKKLRALKIPFFERDKIIYKPPVSNGGRAGRKHAFLKNTYQQTKLDN